MPRWTKSLAVLTVVVCVTAVFSVPAFATVGGAGYTTWSTLGGANGTSPHGGYSNTTQKCIVCHAVHAASSGGQLLLRGTVSGACDYCHISTSVSSFQVYDSAPGNYLGTDYQNSHNSFTISGVQAGVQCRSCHQVHAATSMMTASGYLTSKLLKGPKVYSAIPQPNYDPVAREPKLGDAPELALTKWCAGCHFSLNMAGNAYSYYAPTYDQDTHVMTTATAAYAGSGEYAGRVAWDGSNYCSSCHESGFGTSAWPHYTAGVRFLTQSADISATTNPAADAQQDGICLRCHRGGDATSGIGKGF